MAPPSGRHFSTAEHMFEHVRMRSQVSRVSLRHRDVLVPGHLFSQAKSDCFTSLVLFKGIIFNVRATVLSFTKETISRYVIYGPNRATRIAPRKWEKGPFIFNERTSPCDLEIALASSRRFLCARPRLFAFQSWPSADAPRHFFPRWRRFASPLRHDRGVKINTRVLGFRQPPQIRAKRDVFAFCRSHGMAERECSPPWAPGAKIIAVARIFSDPRCFEAATRSGQNAVTRPRRLGLAVGEFLGPAFRAPRARYGAKGARTRALSIRR